MSGGAYSHVRTLRAFEWKDGAAVPCEYVGNRRVVVAVPPPSVFVMVGQEATKRERRYMARHDRLGRPIRGRRAARRLWTPPGLSYLSRKESDEVHDLAGRILNRRADPDDVDATLARWAADRVSYLSVVASKLQRLASEAYESERVRE